MAGPMRARIEAIAELDDIVPLLADCGLPVADISAARAPQFFGIRAESGLVAVIGLELFGPVGLLRSLAVSPAQRGHGLAQQLVAFAEHVAASRGVDALFLLTTTAPAFFGKLGFVPASRSAAPPAIQATPQFSGLCPASSAFLSKSVAVSIEPAQKVAQAAQFNRESSIMHIRIATPADASAIVAMAIAFRNHLERAAPSDAQFGLSVQALLASPDAEFFVASTDQQTAGYVLQRYRHSMWASGTEATIEDLFVDPSVRKRGTGRALIEFALARAADAGCASVCLDTNEFNVASTRIYTELGFNSVSKRWNGRQIFFRKAIERQFNADKSGS